MGDSNGDEDGDDVYGDGSGGNSPSRRRAGTETSVPRTWLRDGGGYVTFRGGRPIVLGFSRRTEYIGERAEPGGGQVGHTLARRGQGVTRAWGWCGPARPPPGLPFWLLESSDEILTSHKFRPIPRIFPV